VIVEAFYQLDFLAAMFLEKLLVFVGALKLTTADSEFPDEKFSQTVKCKLFLAC